MNKKTSGKGTGSNWINSIANFIQSASARRPATAAMRYALQLCKCHDDAMMMFGSPRKAFYDSGNGRGQCLQAFEDKNSVDIVISCFCQTTIIALCD